MNEDPYAEIDVYLNLVRSHLPDEIADEIIHEIRTYLVDMAQELGHGQVSIESARRSIARFGAPSEIAQEYSRSILDVEDKASDEEPGYEESDPKSARVSAKKIPKQIRTTFGLILIWFALFVIVIVLVAYSVTPTHEVYIQTVLDVIIVGSIFLVLLLVYFLYRLLLVNIIGSSSIFGERSWIEIVVDFIASFLAMVIIGPAGSAMYRPYLWNYGTDIASQMMQLVGLTSVIMLCLILIRLFGDLLSLARPKDQARAFETLISSGFVLSLGLAFTIGVAIPIEGPHLLFWSHYTLLFFVAFFLAFQASTSLIKLVEIRRKTSTSGQALANYR
jgi:hypothetical protein